MKKIKYFYRIKKLFLIFIFVIGVVFGYKSTSAKIEDYLPFTDTDIVTHTDVVKKESELCPQLYKLHKTAVEIDKVKKCVKKCFRNNNDRCENFSECLADIDCTVCMNRCIENCDGDIDNIIIELKYLR